MSIIYTHARTHNTHTHTHNFQINNNFKVDGLYMKPLSVFVLVLLFLSVCVGV